jgi:peptide-methionine (S)-S-oxide reductase
MGKYNKIEAAYFAGGCFWCLEAVFMRTKGVISSVSGYAGGVTDDPTYGEVSKGKTGHAETVKLEYDQTKISYKDLLSIFFFAHDPTGLDHQGKGVRTQYRSIIFYENNEQKAAAEEFVKRLKIEGPYTRPIVTEIKPLVRFFGAEEDQQQYFERNLDDPYCAFVIVPKLEKFKKIFKRFYEQ